MITNSQIQAGWISSLKSKTNVTTLVSAVEIREDLWKGTEFSYPNIRVKLGDLTPTTQNANCNTFRSPVSILVFIEQKSSKTADDIAGVVATEYVGKSFTVGGVRIYGITLESLSPAITPERDENSWMASVNLIALVSPA
jgi:hypothetical protein